MRIYKDVNLPEARNVIKLDHLPSFDIEDYDLNDPKELNRFFQQVERICRNSRAYRKMVEFLRDFVDMNKCSFYHNISNIGDYGVKIHIHHEPLTLYDIVSTVYAKRLDRREPVTENMVAKEVMYNHYKMMVGLIPLSETVHELVHSGYLFIPTTKVFGHYKEFVRVYEKYIDPNILRALEKNEQISLTYDFAKETRILNVNMTYIDPSGSYDLPNSETVIKLLKNRIDEYDSQPNIIP